MKTDDMPGNQLEVGIDELEKGMTILAYIGFDSKFEPIDEQTREWLVLNFKGTRISVRRSDRETVVGVDELKPDDFIVRIGDFPHELSSICRVNPRLVDELRMRGFNRFVVKKEKIKLADRVKRTNRFIAKVRESVDVRDQATNAVASMMDSFRDRNASLKTVETFIGDIVQNDRAEAMAAVMSLIENDYVYAHSVDVGTVFYQVYYKIIKLQGKESIFKDEKEAMMAAFLHDIGKARLPKHVIESRAPFAKDGEEMNLIRKHPEYGAELLQSIGMPDYIINMAHYHHVKLDTSLTTSYPQKVKRDDVLMETSLLALVDVYQALVSGRSYKRSWTPPAVMRYLDAMAGVEFDLDLWADFLRVMGHYPIGSLVRLNDDSLAFVVSVPEKDPLKPQVAVVRDASGKDLDGHILIDLAEEETFKIVKDIDSQEVFKEKALDAFTRINIK